MSIVRVRDAVGLGDVLLMQETAVIDDQEHFANTEMLFGDLVHVDEIAQPPAQADETVVIAQNLFRVFHHDAREVVAVARGETGERAGKAGGIE